MHSATKQKPIDIVTGHLNLEDPFDIDCNISLMSNYVQNHKDKVKLLYQKINEKLQNQKEQVAKKYNENINQPTLRENETFYPKELQRITKVQNKFRGKEQIDTIDPSKNVIKTTKRAYHTRNIKTGKNNTGRSPTGSPSFWH